MAVKEDSSTFHVSPVAFLFVSVALLSLPLFPAIHLLVNAVHSDDNTFIHPRWLEKREQRRPAIDDNEADNGLDRHSRKYYDLLEVSPDASDADLKKAYRKK